MQSDLEVPATMKAVIYDRYEHEGEGIRFVNDHPTPETGGELVVLKCVASSLNPVDYKLWKLPVVGMMIDSKVLGLDVSGVVVYAPEGSGFKSGDEVFGFAKSGKAGSFAEYAATKAEYLTKKPSCISHIEAAMLPTAAVTSLQALRDAGKVSEGDKVLVIGGSGGCGGFGVQVAKALGAKVTAICSTKNADYVKSLGADQVHCYDSAEGPVPKIDKKEDKFDCVYDTVSAPAEPEKVNYEPVARPLLRNTGSNLPRGKADTKPPRLSMYVAINASPVDWAKGLAFRALPFLNLQRHGYKLVITEHKKEALEWLADAVEKGQISAHADDVSLDQKLELTREHVNIGLERMKSRRTKGKVVFGISETAWDEYLDKHKSS